MAERRRTGKSRGRTDGRDSGERARVADEDTGSAKAAVPPRDDAAERGLASLFAMGVPAAGVIAALIVGQVGGLAPAILVLAGAALLGTIGFFWASLRTLSGEAPLPEGISDQALFSRVPAPERKRETLRALKDLEFEHSIGKIDEADYVLLSTRYRATAKALMREMDEGLAPRREKAEKLVTSYLAKRDLGVSPKKEEEKDDDGDAVAEALTREPKEPEPIASPRLECAKCGVSNEPDAAFCKKCGGSLASDASDPEEKPVASV
jgi:hypothetical protein